MALGGSLASGQVISGGFRGSVGNSFKSLYSGKPNAPIKRSIVATPTRGSFGSPTTAPTVGDPNRENYGVPDPTGLNQTRGEAARAARNFANPRGSKAFKNLMGLAQEQTGQQAQERARESRDAGQRRGYAGGFEDSERETQKDRMEALASAGFQGAESVRAAEGEQYGRAISAFTQLQTSYNEAKSAGDISFARDLTATHLANAENTLKTAGLNMEQQLAYAGALNDAKMLQAKLDQDFNNSLIDNNKYIEAQQQIAAQLMAQQLALNEKKREFDADAQFRDKAFNEQQRQFDLGLKANPNTALRTFADPRYGGPKDRRATTARGSVFTGLV